MHSRIFVLRDDKDLGGDNFFHPKPIDIGKEVDYIDDSDLQDDIKWFIDYYSLSFEKKDGRYFMNREDFHRALEFEKYKKLKKAKNILTSKPLYELKELEIWDAYSSLSDDSGFLFIYNRNPYVEGPIELSFELINNRNRKELEIVKSYDYHF